MQGNLLIRLQVDDDRFIDQLCVSCERLCILHCPGYTMYTGVYRLYADHSGQATPPSPVYAQSTSVCCCPFTTPGCGHCSHKLYTPLTSVYASSPTLCLFLTLFTLCFSTIIPHTLCRVVQSDAADRNIFNKMIKRA